MSGLNKVQLIGRLGQDPEIRYTQASNAVANLSLATSETWKDKNTGEKQERTEWHRVVLFGKIAEIAGEYLRKGSLVYIEGKLQTQKWTDNDGIERYTTQIVVQPFSGTMQMLSSKSEINQNSNSNNQNSNKGWGHPQQPKHPPKHPQQQHDEPPMDFDDDIPF